MNEKAKFEDGAKPSPSLIDSGKASDGETPGADLANVRVLATEAFCRKIAEILRPTGLLVTGFEADPKKKPGVYRMFLAGRGE
jgi:hypothetical protein